MRPEHLFENFPLARRLYLEKKISFEALSKLNQDQPELINWDLTHADLSNLDLSGVNFSQSNLSEANLSGSILVGADFSEACLKNANLSKITTRNNNSFVNSCYARFTHANLSGANLARADLSAADFCGADLREIDRFGASFIAIKRYKEIRALFDEETLVYGEDIRKQKEFLNYFINTFSTIRRSHLTLFEPNFLNELATIDRQDKREITDAEQWLLIIDLANKSNSSEIDEYRRVGTVFNIVEAYQNKDFDLASRLEGEAHKSECVLS